jgi:nuclear pore complex protein Nup205
VTIDGEEYSLNEQFQQDVLYLSDEAEVDEIEATRYLLESKADQAVLSRPLLECAVIRYHQQRHYLLECTRLLIELDSLDEDDIPDTPPETLVDLSSFTAAIILKTGAKGIVPRCMRAMQFIKAWLQKVSDRITAASVLTGTQAGKLSEEMETVEFSRVNLVQQHELLGVILSRAVDKDKATVDDFKSFLQRMKAADKYDQLLGET